MRAYSGGSRVFSGRKTVISTQHRGRSAALPRCVSIVLSGCSLVQLCLSGGCGFGQRDDAVASSRMTVDDILGRSADAHLHVRTFQARGLLRDYRGDERKVLPISWDYVRPDRCRLQIDMDVALVVGGDWWTYDHAGGRFQSRRQTTSTPIETAAYFISRGVPFLLPDALGRGKSAFHATDYRRRAKWTLERVTWFAERPCYALARIGLGRDRGTRWRLWIDQDQFFVRGWAWEGMPPARRQQTILGCTYYEVIADQPIAPQRFQVVKPQPIVLPKREAPSD